MLLKQIFKKNTTLHFQKSVRASVVISKDVSTMQGNPNHLLSCHKIKYQLNHTNHFSFSKVSHLINPFTKQPLSDRHYISDQAIVERINKVTQKQKQWKKLSIPERIALVQKLVDAVLADEKMLTEIIANQIGKSVKNIKDQFQQLRDQIPFLLGEGTQALNPLTIVDNESGIVKIVPEPIGLTMIFPHYSEPIFDCMIHMIPCLVSGSAVLIKPADYNHFLGPYLEKKALQILGCDIVADMYLQPEDLSKLSQFRSFKKVVYSGSHSSAKHIFEVLTEKKFIDCNMYFGGQDAIFVDETANIPEAISQIMKSAFINNGQPYDAVKRLYLKEQIYQKVVQILKENILKIKLGDPKDQQTDLGPLAIPEAAITIEQLVNEAISMGAKCEVGGSITSVETGEGIFFEPTLLTDLSNQMGILRTHSPAPILCCFSVSSDDDFLNSFNDSRFGARVKIFTKNASPKQQLSRFQYLIENLQVGSIVINKGSVRTSNRRLQSWRASTNNRKSSSRVYEQYTIPKVLDI